jgi:uncharacterized protein (TIGR02646 family)
MRKINKGHEPDEWTAYRLTPDATYKRIPELADALLCRQGKICAYCQRRIPVKDFNSNETTRIDHVFSQTKHSVLQLDFNNMVICCPGAITNDFHCDKSKGEEDVTIPIFEAYFVQTIEYATFDGKIKSTNPTWNKEIDSKDILNLNNKQLKRNGKEALTAATLTLNQTNPWKKSDIRKLITEWDNTDNEGDYKPYNGIVVWYLKKNLIQRP